MELFETAAAMRAWADAQIKGGHRVVLVPTMGYLHEGHLSLVEEARRHGDRVVVSIFVNPTQFGPQEDLDTYPRDLAGDLAKLQGVHAVFAPRPDTMYPPGFDTYVVPHEREARLCGAGRPDHFRGVCTVVLLLFQITRCHAGIFGQKDFQQLQIIRGMVKDLWLDVEIIGMPTVREPDGLAMSSRNAYLSPEERDRALVISRTLDWMASAVASGRRDLASLAQEGRERIGQVAGVALEYLEIVEPYSLQPAETLGDRGAVCAVAARVGATRLIDNRELG